MADQNIPVNITPIRKVRRAQPFASQLKDWWDQPKPVIYKCIGIPSSQHPKNLLSDQDMDAMIAAYNRQKHKFDVVQKMIDQIDISGFAIMPDSADFDTQVFTQIPPKK